MGLGWFKITRNVWSCLWCGGHLWVISPLSRINETFINSSRGSRPKLNLDTNYSLANCPSSCSNESQWVWIISDNCNHHHGRHCRGGQWDQLPVPEVSAAIEAVLDPLQHGRAHPGRAESPHLPRSEHRCGVPGREHCHLVTDDCYLSCEK